MSLVLGEIEPVPLFLKWPSYMFSYVAFRIVELFSIEITQSNSIFLFVILRGIKEFCRILRVLSANYFLIG